MLAQEISPVVRFSNLSRYTVGGRSVTSLDTLVERIDNLIKQNDKQHAENTRRLDQISSDQRDTSNRLSSAEKSISAHWLALVCIGSILLAILAALLSKLLLS